MDHCRASELEYVLVPRKGSVLETKILLNFVVTPCVLLSYSIITPTAAHI